MKLAFIMIDVFGKGDWYVLGLYFRGDEAIAPVVIRMNKARKESHRRRRLLGAEALFSNYCLVLFCEF